MNKVLHRELAIAWDEYNSYNGKSNPHRVAAILRTMPPMTLVALLMKRNAFPREVNNTNDDYPTAA